MKLSEELRGLAFLELDDPVSHYDKLSEKAKELEFQSNINAILIEQLGKAVVQDAIDQYLKQNVQ